MKLTWIKFIKCVLLMLLLPLAACVPIRSGTIPPAASPTPGSTAADLANTSWQLVSFGPTGALIPMIAGSTISLAFSADGQATGNGGCNTYGGSYTVQGDTLVFGEIVSTLMACADQTVTDQEQQYLQALHTANRFEITADTLTIEYDNGSSVLNFVRASAVATSLPPTPAVTPAPNEPPEQVEFTTASATAQRSSLMPSGPGVKQYVLTANAGQTMTVDVTSADVPLSLTITEPNGMMRIAEVSQTASGYHIGHKFTLTDTGDYLVTLRKDDHTPSTNYTVDFTLQ